MSSSLPRSRSLRKPAVGELGHKKDAETDLDSQSNARTVSPSRLPLRGAAPAVSTSTRTTRTTRAASTAGSSRGDDNGTTASRSRPISGIFGLGRSASVRQPAPNTATNSSSSTTVSRPPITTRNRPAARPTSFSGPSPTTSSRPTTSSGVPSTSTSSSSTTAAPAPARGHARTRSSATVLTGATVLRPPSRPSPTPSSAPPQPPAPAPTSTRTATHARQPSVSASTTSSTGPPTTAPSAASSAPRPAFTTLQRHFSPAKHPLQPKPLTATFLAAPSPSRRPANVALSAETARLQTELLQLHLLHRAATGGTRAGWEASARAALAERFARAAALGGAVAREERRVGDAVDAAALAAWSERGGGGTATGLDEKVALLDGVLGLVWAAGERGGRYRAVVAGFERWAEAVREVVAGRRGARAGGGEEVVAVFVSELDAGWKEDCVGLERKLVECRETLLRLGRGVDLEARASSLARILVGVMALVDDMLAELELMQDIEREAVRAESEWVKAVNRDGVGRDEDDTPRAGAIWRAL